MSGSGAYHDSEYAEVRYDESLDAVRVDWKRAANHEDFETVLDQALELVTEEEATNWIADLREMGAVHPDDQAWVNEEWFPRALSTSLSRMAVVRSADFVQNQSVDSIMQEVGDGLVHHYFDSTDDAERWLQE